MTLCLYECLRAIGLQHHYARFTSMGVRRAAHLSALTMEDYPILGIRTMEDRTRLFRLVQLVKTLDLESLGFEDGDDDDNDADGGDEDNTAADCSFTYDGYEDCDEDAYEDEEEKGAAMCNLKPATFSKPSSVRRRLDFSSESIDHHQKLFPRPAGTVHVSAGYNRNDEPIQVKRSAVIPVQLEHQSASAAICGCPGRNNNHRSDVQDRPSDHHTGENTKPDINRGISKHSSQITRLTPKCEMFHKPKPQPAVASKRFSNKPVGQKDRKGISVRQKLSTEMSINGAREGMAKLKPVYESKRTADYNYGLPLSPPSASNRKQTGAQRIIVCVRKRPLTRAESRRGEDDVVTTPGGECVIVHESKEAVDLTEYILQHRFFFDQVFGDESSNEEVYQRTAYPLVQHMLNGGKATCFAYGQTGAGKTHTMLGSLPGRPGLYALAAQDIFAHLSTTHTSSPLLVYVSFFEIYCGQLYDLLDHRKRLFAREDGQKVVHIAGLCNVRVDSVSSLLEVIMQGTEERTQGMSGVNPLSSRSHALLQIQLRGPNQQITGRMWFVDLAGSERASDTKEPDRQSRMEGAEINQSLLALKECIRSLDQEQSHTPFRQSKLTQVLKDSFVGDSMTCMIANISPGHLATEHTLNTLRYADRVKELRGQGGLRGGRRGKTIPSPKRNLSNSNSSSGSSSIGTRGKSPPKKPKLGRRREAFGPISPATILCSTPKNSRWAQETSARARQRIGLEQITPVTDDKKQRRERAVEREDRRKASEERYGRTDSYSVVDQNTGAGLVLRQPTDGQHHSWEVPRERVAQEGHLSFAQRESGFYHRGEKKQQITLKMGREEERRWRDQRRQVESIRDTHVEVKRTRESDFQKAEERDKEKERHLRQYHQQLQQFLPSSASSSFHVSSPSTSLSSSNHPSLSSFVPASSSSSLGNSSHLSISALTHCGLEEVLSTYKARVEVRADGNRGQLPFPYRGGETRLQAEISPTYNITNDEDGHGDSSGVGEDLRESWEGTEARFGQDSSKSEKRRSLEGTSKGGVRVKKGDRRPAVMERGEMRWAWVATTESEEADRMAGAKVTSKEKVVSYNYASEERRNVRQEGMDAPVWSAEEGDGYSLVSAHSTNESNSFFNQSPVESPHQRAPAERPLSPACEHTNTLLTPNKFSDLSLVSKHSRCTTNIMPLPLQNAQQQVPSSSRSSREKEPRSAAIASRKEFPDAQSAKLPLTTSITQNGSKIPVKPLNKLSENLTGIQVHNHPEVKARMSVLPQEESFLSDIMDPLSISLLEVEQQAATASFLQGEQSNNSLCPENEREHNNREVEKKRPTCAETEVKVQKDEDVEFHLSLLELPQAKIHRPPTSDTMNGTDHTKFRKDRCCATQGHCGKGMVEPLIPEVMQQDQENSQKPQTQSARAPESPLKPCPHASMQTSVIQPISSFPQHSGNTGSPGSHSGATKTPPKYAENMHTKPASSVSLPQSESVLGHVNSMPNQCHSVHSDQPSNSSISLQNNRLTESNSQESTSSQQIGPIIHLSTLEDLDHAQWRVVQAHWEQLEEMEALYRKEGTLLCQQPDMAFEDYVHKLEDIMERKAQCVNSMRAQLQPYLKPDPSSDHQYKQEEDNHEPIT